MWQKIGNIGATDPLTLRFQADFRLYLNAKNKVLVKNVIDFRLLLNNNK